MKIIDEYTLYRPSGGTTGGGIVEQRKGFTIRSRGDVGGLIAHEYECPDHGRFSMQVERSDVPDWRPCPHPDPVGGTPGIECRNWSTWCPPIVAIGKPPGEVDS